MTVHVVGAGLAGLAAALAASREGAPVTLHEAAPQAGGRCRSFQAPGDGGGFGRVDNGAHVILGANRSAFAYLEEIGARDRVTPAADAIPLLDLDGRAGSRVAVAGSALAALGRIGIGRGLRTAFLRAVFNAPPRSVPSRERLGVAARIARAGRGAMVPWVARRSLDDAFVAPALAALAARGVAFRPGARLAAVDVAGGRIRALSFADGTVGLGAGDVAILAVPPDALARLLPRAVAGTPVPAAIVNVHFDMGSEVALPGGAALLALAGGTADWLFARDRILTATTSAADGLVARDGAEIARAMWQDVLRALGRENAGLPSFRVVKERKATWRGARPRPSALPRNAAACGDWCMAGLPCSIEAALASGRAAGEWGRVYAA